MEERRLLETITSAVNFLAEQRRASNDNTGENNDERRLLETITSAVHFLAEQRRASNGNTGENHCCTCTCFTNKELRPRPVATVQPYHPDTPPPENPLGQQILLPAGHHSPLPGSDGEQPPSPALLPQDDEVFLDEEEVSNDSGSLYMPTSSDSDQIRRRPQTRRRRSVIQISSSDSSDEEVARPPRRRPRLARSFSQNQPSTSRQPYQPSTSTAGVIRDVTSETPHSRPSGPFLSSSSDEEDIGAARHWMRRLHPESHGHLPSESNDDRSSHGSRFDSDPEGAAQDIQMSIGDIVEEVLREAGFL